MTDEAPPDVVDVGEYCRRVEEHLTRVNAGHLVRIAGTAFAMVRGWAQQGIPLSAVFRGIDLKAERHRERATRHPLRIEFCEPDVLTVFDQWRRAVGVRPIAPAEDGGEGDEAAASPAATKRPALSRHLDRAIERLGRAGGRLEWPEPLREACDRVLQSLAALRSRASGARGAARDALAAELPALDRQLAEALRDHAPEADRVDARRDAETDLAPYSARLEAGQWERAVDTTADRHLRDRLGLPTLEW